MGLSNEDEGPVRPDRSLIRDRPAKRGRTVWYGTVPARGERQAAPGRFSI